MLLRLLTAISLACTAAAIITRPAAADETMFSLLEKGLDTKAKGSDYAVSERTVYGKWFDAWIKAYCEGRKADASVAWSHVLNESRGAHNLYELAGLVNRRLQFLEGNQSRALEKRGGVLGALKNILEETQTSLGDSFWTASIADYISDRYVKTRHWKEAIVYAKCSVLTKQRAPMISPQEIFISVMKLARLQYNNHEYSAAKTNAEQALIVATKLHAADGISQARTLLSKIRTATL